jgi:hypothetical protein
VVHKFSQISGSYSKILRHQKGKMRQVPNWGPTNIRCHRTQFSFHDDPTPGNCAPLA